MASRKKELLIYLFFVFFFMKEIAAQQTPETFNLEIDTAEIDLQAQSDLNTTDSSTNDETVATEVVIVSTESDHEMTSVENNNSSNFDTTSEGYRTTAPPTSTPQVVTCGRSYCNNHGQCFNSTSEQYECDCDEGYAGSKCTTRDFCLRKDGTVCEGGACVYNDDLTKRYCSCSNGKFWDPKHKECKKPIPPCFPNPCENGGTCESIRGGFNCTCKQPYSGATCEYVNHCGTGKSQGDCGKGGTCKLNKQRKEFTCECHQEFYLQPETLTCLPVKLPCEPNPCSDHGTCSQIDDDSESFNCSCNEMYVGEYCQTRDRCVTDDAGDNLCPNGKCEVSDDESAQFCSCDEGYFLEESSGKCIEHRPPCEPNPCFNGGTCNVLSDEEFNCTCIEGFAGERCNYRDSCKLDGGEVFCGEADCIMDNQYGVFHCSCSDGEYFDYSTWKCKVLDYCPLMSCDPTEACRNSTCICAEGFKVVEDNGGCTADFCTKYGCPSEDMICEESRSDRPEDFKCFCEKGHSFNGTDCVPAACLFPSLNNCSQICSDRDVGFKCDCAKHFKLDNETSNCKYDGEAESCVNDTCSPGSCIYYYEQREDVNKTKCICPPGYVEQHGKCIDACSADRLPLGICPNDKCISVDGRGFTCDCRGRYMFSDDETTCTVRKMCKEGEVGAEKCSQRGAACIEDWSNEDGYQCKCPPGYDDIRGKCERICDIPEHQIACSKLNAVCDTDENHEFRCKCPPAFSSKSNGTNCTIFAEFSYTITLPVSAQRYKSTTQSSSRKDVDLHLLNMDVSESMKHLFESFKAANVLRCWSTTTKIMIQCNVEIQLSQAEEKGFDRMMSLFPLQYNKTISDDYVLLPPSLVLVNNEEALSAMKFRNTSVCDEDIKVQMCGSETECNEFVMKKGFTCTCMTGYINRYRVYPTDDRETYVETCRDVDECIEGGKVCPANSQCFNTMGSYRCSCLVGYRPKRKSEESKDIVCVDQCEPNPCSHGDCIKSGEHGFQCTCKAGFAGSLCDLEDINYKAANVRTIVVGAVLGGILLICVILSISTISRIRKKKRLDDPSRILYCAEMTERRPVMMTATNAAFDRE